MSCLIALLLLRMLSVNSYQWLCVARCRLKLALCLVTKQVPTRSLTESGKSAPKIEITWSLFQHPALADGIRYRVREFSVLVWVSGKSSVLSSRRLQTCLRSDAGRLPCDQDGGFQCWPNLPQPGFNSKPYSPRVQNTGGTR